MELGLKGKVALVTGAGSPVGFGRAIALTLAREGCDIIASDKDREGAQKTAAEVKALGRKAIAIKTDVTNSGEVNDMVQAALAQFGKIDILVNNAGATTTPKPFAEMTEKEWRFNIDVNLVGVLNCTKAVLNHMISRKSGKIVNIASGAARGGSANWTVYSAAKAGVIAFAKSLAREVITSGVYVNCIAPGIADTGFSLYSPPGWAESHLPIIPQGKLTTPQDIANMAAFLASDVSNNIVGQTFDVNGGIVMY